MRFPHRLRRELMSPRWYLWGLAGLLVGGIIHILIVLSVPTQVPFNIFDKVARFGPDRQFHMLPPVLPRTEPLVDLDPAMRHAICRYQLDEGPILVRAEVSSPFWSVALFNREGQTIYSLNDRTADKGEISMLVITQQQLAILRENPPADLEEMIIIETEEVDGFALLRAFVPSAAYEPQVLDGLERAECTSRINQI
ncbi:MULTISPECIES: hypothetical protein [Pseudovibrio]|uniref:DUF1254 domain-containing protein n=1 Tax=Stappiaceae TaxID=2821832 RepID=UPI0023666C34|nr:MULTISPECIES: hypothetical protein [Pseudovibrio]MDD7909157.1 hypothetical protein [Pseudovibrio exalbescens]MDX5595601.1 hypothetical protein [Pseudovibrio sp. SPO723]